MDKAFKLDTKEWDKVFPQYRRLSKRTLATAINAKAYYIARRAVVETPKAKLGRMSRKTAETLGKIINQRHGERGEKGLYGDAMRKAVEIVYAARRRSVAFLKSGWLPAIRLLESHLGPKDRRGAAKNDRSAKQIGKPKGRAVPAGSGWKVTALIENAALATRDKKEALQLYGGPALQRAFNFEIQSMKDYIARKMTESARSLGIKTG